MMSRTLRMAGIASVAFFALTLTTRSDEKAKPIEGAWKEVEARNGDAQEYQKPPAGAAIHDLIVGGRFALTIVQEGKVVGLIGGRYKSEGEKYTEIIEFVTGEGIPESFVGSSFEFTVKFDGDKFTKVGTIKVDGMDYKIDEKWERCKP
jgi:hypothetical protein